jgi:hypothetical protein
MNALLIGALAALLLASAAYLRSRARGGFYDSGVYGMTRAAHRRYAYIALAFAVAFAVSVRWLANGSETIFLWAAFVLFSVFYATSFLRGAHDDDE